MLKESGDIQNLKLTGSFTNRLKIIALGLLKKLNSPTMKAKYSSAMEIKKDFSVLFSLFNTANQSLNFLTDTWAQTYLKFSTIFFVNKIRDIRAKLDAAVNPNENYDEVESANSQLKELIPATESEIHKIIVSSKNCTTSSDPIPTCVLKKCVYPGSVLLVFITKIVNLSIQLGQFPSFLKHALVKPLLKKTNLDHNVLQNYRPVSNLPFLSKIIEKTVCNRLIEHLNSNNLYEPLQSAYHKGHSTETALVRLHNDILINLHSNRGVVLILLDLSAAFDMINHSLMIKRLENHRYHRYQSYSLRMVYITFAGPFSSSIHRWLYFRKYITCHKVLSSDRLNIQSILFLWVTSSGNSISSIICMQMIHSCM